MMESLIKKLRNLNVRLDEVYAGELLTEGIATDHPVHGAVGSAILVPHGDHWVYLAVNQTLAAMNGSPKEEHWAHTTVDVLGPELAGKADQLLWDAWSGKEVVDVRVEGRATNGPVDQWMVTYQAVRRPSGRPVAIIALVRPA